MKAVPFVLGLLIVFGAVGGPDTESLTQILITAAIGLALMAFGVVRMRQEHSKAYFHEGL